MEKDFLKNAALFLGLFVFFSLPAFLYTRSVKLQKVEVVFPKDNGKRQLASHSESPDFNLCEPRLRWRYKCNDDRSQCKKDRQETYMRCRDL